MNTRLTIFSVLLVSILALTACNHATFFSDHQRVDEEGWNMNDDVRFDVDIKDTSRMYDFYIDVRNLSDYPYSNLFLFITTTFPDHAVRRDTLECPLADVYGNWYGKGAGKYIDGRYPLHGRVIFPQSGTYCFQIAHAMRDTNITGIKNIGLHIEYSNNQ